MKCVYGLKHDEATEIRCDVSQIENDLFMGVGGWVRLFDFKQILRLMNCASPYVFSNIHASQIYLQKEDTAFEFNVLVCI